MDPFRQLASVWMRVDIHDVTDSMRQQAKQLSYGIIYGMGAASLSNQLGVSTEEADDLIRTFMETYPGVRDFLRRTVEFCRRHGYVETITGRRRLLPDILSTDAGTRAQVCHMVRSCMESALPLSAPLAVRLSAGPSWGQLTELGSAGVTWGHLGSAD
ncbi:unnamed protein product [Lampetra planeri]